MKNMTPEAYEMYKQFLSTIVAAIKSLPEEQQIIYWLVKLDHMSFETTAATLGITIDSVRVKLAKAQLGITKYLNTQQNIIDHAEINR